MRIGGALVGVLVFGGLVFAAGAGAARRSGPSCEGSTAGPTIDDYVKQAGPEAKIIAAWHPQDRRHGR